MKKISLIILIIGLSIIFVACGGDSPDKAAEEWFQAVATFDGASTLTLTCDAYKDEVQSLGFVVFGLNILSGGLAADIEVDTSGLRFNTISQSGNEAVVNVRGSYAQGMLGAAIEQQVDTNIIMVKEDGKWKYCGESQGGVAIKSLGEQEPSLPATDIPSTETVLSATPSPTEKPAVPSDTPKPSNTPIPTSTPVVISEDMDIPFSSPDDPIELDENWSWSPGPSESSAYRISQDTGVLTLIAGPGTNLWKNENSAPRIEYPVTGDFQVQVRLDLDPREKWQGAGLAIQSKTDPGTWVTVRRGCCGQSINFAQTHDNRSEGVTTIPYAKTTTYLKMIREGELLSIAVSENGVNWIDLRTAHVFSLPDEVYILLYVYSTTGHGITADFSELRIGPPEEKQVNTADSPFTFERSADPNQLNSAWSWLPNASPDSTFNITDGKLTLITGPKTDLWDKKNSAPRVEFPIEGNFQVQVRLDFDPSKKWQFAGLGVRHATDTGNWVVVRRGCCGQAATFIQTLNNSSETVTGYEYADTTIYFRIKNEDPLISLYYSSDGINWTPLKEEFVMGFPEQAYIFLFVYSTTNQGISATFSELGLSPP